MTDAAVETRSPDAEAIRDELARTTLELCEIPSETLHETAIADWVQARCEAVAGKAGVVRIGNSVVCDPSGAAGDGRPTVALVGHLDTVRCAEGQPYGINEGRVYGCGASDMKAGVAVMLALLDRWRELGTARPVWIFYDGEEGPAEGNGLEAVLLTPALPKIDFAFILEPTDQAMQPGCMGVLHATVTVRGVRAHSARPWQGINAIYRAVPLLERFNRLERREVVVDGLTFYEVIVVTQARTENSKNVVPDAMMLNVNFRFAPGNTAEGAEAELRSIVGEDADVEVIDSAPAGTVHSDHPVIAEWARREGLRILPKQAWTDVARFTSHGIPAVNFGPGETSQCHQANEWCSVDSLESCFMALHRFFAA
ncbi:MAG TPA: succinyl-diaminopimelate desuccinylase [Longimicrobiaceae bacterium]|jgi:succinyl-diaminopimelate desuccinylase|nr:succinyl-diaminopimelate desuccinylase [Longimicrobiaceae bacterium]